MSLLDALESRTGASPLVVINIVGIVFCVWLYNDAFNNDDVEIWYQQTILIVIVGIALVTIAHISILAGFIGAG